MTSYTGVVKKMSPELYVGGPFPLTNVFAQNILPKAASRYHWEVYAIELTGTAAAIGTDDYTFTAFVAPRGLVVESAFIVDPVGIAVDGSNYLTIQVRKSSTLLCTMVTTYGGIAPNLPREIAPYASVATRTLAKGDSVIRDIVKCCGLSRVRRRSFQVAPPHGRCCVSRHEVGFGRHL